MIFFTLYSVHGKQRAYCTDGKINIIKVYNFHLYAYQIFSTVQFVVYKTTKMHYFPRTEALTETKFDNVCKFKLRISSEKSI